MNNKEMMIFQRIKYIFKVFYGFGKNHEYTCNSENNFQNIAISSFFISQRAVKSWIISKDSKEFFCHFVRKTFKFKLQKGHFGEKWPFSQILSMWRWV
jgi:hypothetical protein